MVKQVNVDVPKQYWKCEICNSPYYLEHQAKICEKQCGCEHKNIEYCVFCYEGRFEIFKECPDCEKEIASVRINEYDNIPQETLIILFNMAKNG